MKTVLLLRHGKSNSGAGGNDHARVLAARGIDAAKRVGRFLTALDEVPERVVSSSAVRAKQTAQLAAEAGNWERRVELDPDLYDTSAGRMLEWLEKLDDTTGRVLLIGHQPTWSTLTNALIGGGQVRFPSAGIARVDLDISRWRDVEVGCGELVWFQIPGVLAKLGGSQT